MELSLDPRHLLRLAWRRKWLLTIPAAVIGIVALVLTFSLPTLYQSQATILIERQDVPETVVQPLVSDAVERRLEVLTRRVLAPQNLLEIIDRFDLYADERAQLSQGELVQRLRSRIETEILFTPVTDGLARATRATLAFQIRFVDTDPTTARHVTSELASVYLASNREERRSVAEETTRFFTAERETLEREVDRIEEEFAAFKTANRELLPEEADFKRDQLNMLDERLRALEGDLRVLRERQGFLQTQIALTNEFDERAVRGGTTPESQLELLRAELATAEARYSGDHPDVVRLRREVRSLERVVGGRSSGGRSGALAAEEARLSAELATLQDRYTSEHPDVQRVRRELATVRQAISTAGGGDEDGRGRNPAYVQLRAQLNSVDAEIAAIKEQRADLRAEREQLQAQLAQAPEVERAYNGFVRRLDNAIVARDAIAEKETQTRLSGALETTAMGEELSLLEPANVPKSPHSPNRKLILAIGAVFAVGTGSISVVLAELLDRTIRSADELARILGDRALVSIPRIETARDRRRKWLLRLGASVALVAAIGGVGTWVHHRVVPLDALRYQATNQVMTWMSSIAPLGDDREATADERR
jgi:uncharacterized protein involved in exopolysaccharide biosynthesis